MTSPWTTLVRGIGRRAVMSSVVDQATIDAETERQIPLLDLLLTPLLHGNEKLLLDYGCGYGRLSGGLSDITGCLVNAYDPCEELIRQAVPHPAVFYYGPRQPSWRHGKYDIIFAAMVLGDPHTDPLMMAAEMVAFLAPGGLLVVADHMPDEPPRGRWWQFRPVSVYTQMFRSLGIELQEVGGYQQLDNDVTVLAGRWPQ